MTVNANYASIFGANNIYKKSDAYVLFNAQNDLKLYQSFYQTFNNKNAGPNGGLSDAQTSYMNSMRTGAAGLKAAMDQLLGAKKQKSVFEKMTAVSGDKDSLGIISVSGKAVNTAAKVRIDQTAAAQKNAGFGMKANDKSFCGGRYYQFEIEADGKKRQFSFSVRYGESDRSVQQKMADIINNKKIGVWASVSYDAKTGSSLILESASTGIDAGRENRFSVKDISGDAVEKTGIDNITQRAQNALYRVDGGAVQESRQNNVELANGVTIQLRKETESEVSVSWEGDKISSLNAAREMANHFNAMIELARENGGDIGAKRLFDRLAGAAEGQLSGLGRIGIAMNDKGYLSIDEKKMDAAYENGDMRKFFEDGYGFARRLDRAAAQIAEDPSRYALKDAAAGSAVSPGDFGYDFMSRFNQWNNVGTLLNMMF